MDTDRSASKVATASYIQGMLAELRSMSRSIECGFLVYLIEMAHIEASDIVAGKTSQVRHKTPVEPEAGRLSADEIANLYFTGGISRADLDK